MIVIHLHFDPHSAVVQEETADKALEEAGKVVEFFTPRLVNDNFVAS